ncbi:MAG: bifunctional oligoribonuclease/PAP phosphatase NrnA [Spirochaetales bacterium]|nr:bifunctional oligoribonuclease/PAP phosphatase NrnA [Spirochaetales bacterium]
MELTVPDEVITFLGTYTRYLIIGHEEPDGDCLGSQIGLSAYVRARGKEAVLLSPGPFTRPEITRYENNFSSRMPKPAEDSAVVILDCSTADRIGLYSSLIKALPSLVIDHHKTGKDFGDIRWIVPEIPAVTLMIHALFTATGIPVDTQTREALLLGLATDTGFFRHLEEEGSWVFRAAADLIGGTVHPKSTYRLMYGNRSLNSRILLGRILSRVRSHCGGLLLTSWESLEDSRELGQAARDSDLLYSILMGTKGMDALFIIRDESETKISIGLRSLEIADVSIIARDFGGGGHMRAAGFQSSEPREVVEKKLIAIFSDIFCQK